MQHILLSRYAECIFWMARYIERAENLARILDVQETFNRDSRGGQNWRSVVQLNADEKRFFARHDEATAANVIRFYVVDPANPTSILSSIRSARENARTLRPLISTEMWTHANVFYKKISELGEGQITEPRLSRICSMIKENCQTATGITEGTFYRDGGWNFYEMGRYLERADQTTRMIDVKYHHLLPDTDQVGTAMDVSQWNAMLRSAAGYHAYRRVYPRGMNQANVAGFLMLDPRFPRSVMACINSLDVHLSELRTRYRLRRTAPTLELLDELRDVLENHDGSQIIASGLHEFCDWIQLRLIRISAELGRAFFGYEVTSSDQAA